MRIAIIAETFLPTVNGVTRSIEQILRHLAERGDEVLVIAPAEGGLERVSGRCGITVHRLPSVPLATYPSIRLAVGGVGRVRRILEEFAPDVVHLASPFELGRRAVHAAAQLGIPTVAVYQTDVPGYLARYGAPALERWAWQRVTGIHRAADLTLAPSTAALEQLQTHGVPRVALWRRGVDTALFDRRRRDDCWRRSIAPDGARLIGYVGRLAAEKQVADLAALADIPGTRLVIIGDGPLRAGLGTALPTAHFTGHLTGRALATAVASLDLFVHPGELETFCQTIQEAMASGVPVVATARGGPLDLVDHSRTGWLYPPGDLASLRGHVVDLVGDDAKRSAFGEAAAASVRGRTWPVLCAALVAHYEAVVRDRSLSRR
ncbi:MAG: GDP-mannose-dependent alpha-mannosyltransferase [Actinomycetota bacterium]